MKQSTFNKTKDTVATFLTIATDEQLTEFAKYFIKYSPNQARYIAGLLFSILND